MNTTNRLEDNLFKIILVCLLAVGLLSFSQANDAKKTTTTSTTIQQTSGQLVAYNSMYAEKIPTVVIVGKRIKKA